jgi:hypothetical protein
MEEEHEKNGVYGDIVPLRPGRADGGGREGKYHQNRI